MNNAARKPLPHGVVASSVTPFRKDGSLDFPAFKPHLDWLISEGVAGISPLGSSGEFFALESDDRKKVVEAQLEAIDGRVPTMVGSHHYSTRIAIDLSKHAEKAGADALLIVPPYYGLPTVAGVMDHYRRIAEAVSIPINLYHIPGTSEVAITIELLKAMMKYPHLAGIKDSSGNWENTETMLKRFPGFKIFPSSEGVLVKAMRLGAAGCITASGNINAANIRHLVDHWQDANADELQKPVAMVRDLFSKFPLIPAAKAFLSAELNQPGLATLRPPLMAQR